MPYECFERKCPACGTVYKESDFYCSKCGAPLPKYEPKEEELINGIEKSKWCAYIEKNTERYVPVFEKNQNKKHFLFPNIAAMFFGFYWLFYRKMYKEGFIYIACNFILSILLSVLLLFSYQGELKEQIKIIDDYNAYVETMEPNKIYDFYDGAAFETSRTGKEDNEENSDFYSTEYSEKYGKALKAQKKVQEIATAISLWGYFFSLLISAAFGLFADSIYRNHIIRNLNYSDGGVSIPAIFGALAITFLVNAISNPLSEILTNLFIR